MCDLLRDLLTVFLAPILTGVAAGYAVWTIQRRVAVPAEVDRHDRTVARLNDDLQRFVHDLGRDVDRYIGLLAPEVLRERVRGIGAERAGRLPAWLIRSQTERAVEERREAVRERMRDALHQIRDEVLRKEDQYVELAKGEDARHARHREKRELTPAALSLPRDCREIVASWRERDDPFTPTAAPRLRVDEDKTEDEPLVAVVLDTEAGLTWEAASAGVVRLG